MEKRDANLLPVLGRFHTQPLTGDKAKWQLKKSPALYLLGGVKAI
jgi:hypothetical protein